MNVKNIGNERLEFDEMNLPRNKLSTFITCCYPFRLVSIFAGDNAEEVKKIQLTVEDGRNKC